MEKFIFRVSETLNKRETKVKRRERDIRLHIIIVALCVAFLASTTSKRATLVVLVVRRRRRRSAFV